MSVKIDVLVENDLQLNAAYHVNKRIGNGCFGTVFDCMEKASQRHCVIKVEIPAPATGGKETLYKEYSILKMLQSVERVPRVYCFLRTENLNVLQMQPLSQDLEHRLNRKEVLSDNQICDLTVRLIQILRGVHSHNVVHRDLKPQNIMFDENNTPFLIDFGISAIYNKKKPERRPSIPRKGTDFVGTPRYASIAAHSGRQIAPKDDIESLIYVMIFASVGELPWMNVHRKANKIAAIGDMKKRYSKAQLCKSLPKCFLHSLLYLQKVQEQGVVDYDFLIKMFEEEREIVANTASLSNIELSSDSTSVYALKTMESSVVRIMSTDLRQYRLEVPLMFTTGSSFDSNWAILDIVRSIFEEEEEQLEEENLGVEAETSQGEYTLAHKLKALPLVSPKLKATIDRRSLYNLCCPYPSGSANYASNDLGIFKWVTALAFKQKPESYYRSEIQLTF